MKRLFVFALAICLTVGVFPQFLVNGVEPCFDQNTNTFLLSIDEHLWRADWEAYVALPTNSQWDALTINGTDAGGNVCFRHVEGDSIYLVEATIGEEKQHYGLQFTFLPIVKFQKGQFGMDYVTDSVTVQQHGTATAPMKARIKWRGASTNTEGKNKRNYKIKFIDNQGNKQNWSFFGLRSDNTWILDAGQVDLFRMRNLIATQLWHDFAAKPYYADREPKALNASRGQMVEVFLGDCYQGIFNMCEPIDRKQMQLKPFDADSTIHGGLWKAVGFEDTTFFNIPETYDNTKEQNNYWELKYPSIEDLCPSDYTTLWNAIMFTATSSQESFYLHVDEWFDMPVLLDYYLFVQVTNCFDLTGKNVYWAVYDKMEDKKLTPAMWDLDCSMGQNWIDDPLHPDYVGYDANLLTPNNIFYRLNILNVDGFVFKVRQRYASLRSTVFSTTALQQRYIDVYNTLQSSGAATREEQRWSGDTDIAGLPLDFESELAYITDWIEHRMDYLDKRFSYNTLGIESAPLGNGGKEGGKAYTLQGRVAPQGYKGLVVRNGKLLSQF